jgi:hypothetical protein
MVPGKTGRQERARKKIHLSKYFLQPGPNPNQPIQL